MNQGTLEEAAAWMADLTRSYPELHSEFLSALRGGILAAQNGDASVVEAVNRSGYRVSTALEAGECCMELLSLYEEANGVVR